METKAIDLFEETKIKPGIDEDIDYLEYAYSQFDRLFLHTPGQHLIGVGITGSGKTQKAYWILKKLLEYETIVWFDTGKSYEFGKYEEFGPLFTFGVPVHIIYPSGVAISVENAPVPVTYQECPAPARLWDCLKPGCINVVSLARFFIDPELHARYAQKAFNELIVLAINEKPRITNVLPLSIIYDEFSDIAPGRRMQITHGQEKTAKLMAWNIKQLRSIGVRVVCFTQAWFNVFPAVRSSFSWIMACRGAHFEREEPVIAGYNRLHGSLDVWQAIMWFPTREFYGRWKFPLYRSPDGLKIHHKGVLTSL
jgi:hypothetical protein